jgi:FtsZ-binding cell division protein ZapB
VAIDWQAQLDQLETMIQNYIDAINFLTVNPTESYKLDTGQSEQEVKRHNLANMNKTLDSLYNRYSTLCQRIGATPTISLPAW